MKKIIIPTAAQNDLAAIASWYSRVSVVLEEDFAEALNTRLGQIAEFPESCELFHKTHRRTKMAYFPYLIFYRIKKDKVIVSLVVHEKRNPAQWIKRLH